jgi:lambda family phage portal protein
MAKRRSTREQSPALLKPMADAQAMFGPGNAHFGASAARELASWNPLAGSADADLDFDLPTLRSRSRDLVRNHGIASGGIQSIVDNVVGIGAALAPVPDYTALGETKDWAIGWSKTVKSAWRSYAETTDCDAAHSLRFHQITEQIFRAAMVNGEVLVLPLWLPDKTSRFATRFQVIESDRLSNPDHRPDDEHLRAGVEIDDYGRPLAYWIRKTHPGDRFLGFVSTALVDDWERVPATTAWGRPRVLHIHDKERTGQHRGKPLLSSVLAQFRMLDHYQRTELQAAVVNAMVAAFIETPLDGQTVAQMLGSDLSDPRVNEYMAMQRQYMAPLRGAGVFQMPPGSKMEPFLPTRPSDQFAPFIEAVVRHIGAGIGLPLELLLKDFSKTNYSSARAALLEAWRFFLGRRRWLEDCWCRPAYELWLEEAVSNNAVEAPDFYSSRFAYSRCKWTWPGRGWIDPVKEAEAAQIRMDSGLSTLEHECAEQGLDWEEVLEQRAVELARMRELGIPLPNALKPSPPTGEQEQRPEEQAA